MFTLFVLNKTAKQTWIVKQLKTPSQKYLWMIKKEYLLRLGQWSPLYHLYFLVITGPEAPQRVSSLNHSGIWNHVVSVASRRPALGYDRYVVGNVGHLDDKAALARLYGITRVAGKVNRKISASWNLININFKKYVNILLFFVGLEDNQTPVGRFVVCGTRRTHNTSVEVAHCQAVVSHRMAGYQYYSCDNVRFGVLAIVTRGYVYVTRPSDSRCCCCHSRSCQHPQIISFKARGTSIGFLRP